MESENDRQSGYSECYVAFLDILGFKDLVLRSKADASLLERLSKLTEIAARLNPGRKETSDGPLLMQTRSFSDCIVVFTPTKPGRGFATNGFAQLLFVVRFIHDQVLNLGACLRGGIAVGDMYWHSAWDRQDGDDDDTVALPLTFGPGLVSAYELEKKACWPRVLIDLELRERLSRARWNDASPFASGRLPTYFRMDKDREPYLDLLHNRVTRRKDERVRKTTNGFTIEWASEQSRRTQVCETVRRLAEGTIRDHKDPEVREKHRLWLKYLDSVEGAPVGAPAGGDGD